MTSPGPEPAREQRRSMRFAAWPSPLQAAWKEACTSAGFLEEGSVVAGLSSGYRQNVAAAGGHFLAWAAATGQSCTTLCDLQGVARHEALLAFAKAEHVKDIKLTSLTNRLVCLVRFLEAVCPGWKQQESTRQLIRRLQKRARREPVAERHIVHPSHLYGSAIDTMNQLLYHPGGLANPDGWQSALMVAMLTAAPVRIANFSTLQIGTNFLQGDGGWHISLSESETKTRRGDRWQFPPTLQPYINHFLTRVRIDLLSPAGRPTRSHDCLWVSAFGDPLEHQGVRQRIKAFTTNLCGKAILPHSFRHSAVSAFAVDHPDRPRDCAALLGHASAQTTEKHYILGTRQIALETLHRSIEEIRSFPPPPRRGQPF